MGECSTWIRDCDLDVEVLVWIEWRLVWVLVVVQEVLLGKEILWLVANRIHWSGSVCHFTVPLICPQSSCIDDIGEQSDP